MVLGMFGQRHVAEAPATVRFDIPGQDKRAIADQQGVGGPGRGGRGPLCSGRKLITERPVTRRGHAKDVLAERRSRRGPLNIFIVCELGPVAQREAELTGGLPVV